MFTISFRSILSIACGLLSLAAQAQELQPAVDVAMPALRLATRLEFHPNEVDAPSPSTPGVQLAEADDIGSSVAELLVVPTADAMVGTRYRLGGDSETDIDCSALVQMAYREAGVELPRTTGDLVKLGEKVDRSDLRPGDLLFYRWSKRRLHVAVYAGNGEIVHASPNAQQVTRTRLNNDWNRRLVSVRRLI